MDTKKRMTWDNGLADYSELCRPTEYIQIANVISKGKMNFKNRDFLEKRVHFEHEGAFYIYISFVPDNVRNIT